MNRRQKTAALGAIFGVLSTTPPQRGPRRFRLLRQRLEPFIGGHMSECGSRSSLARSNVELVRWTSPTRQNAHSATSSMRDVVELFRAVKKEKQLHREILAFSVSHDHRLVRIYSHYPMIEDQKTTFYRHPIREFSFTELDDKEKCVKRCP
jgi:hypothetical protein